MTRNDPQQPACRTFPPPPTTHTPQPHRRPQLTAHHSIPAEHPGLTHSLAEAMTDALVHLMCANQEDEQ